MTRILFIPEPSAGESSERTPMLYRMLKETHDVIGLPSPLDRYAYDTERAKWPRYLLYVADEVLLGLRGVAWARRNRIDVVFCETSHHALVGVFLARLLGIRCIWDSHANVQTYAASVGKGRFFTTLSVALERFLGKIIDALITVTEREAEAYASMGVPRSKIRVVPTFIVLADIDRKTRTMGGKRVDVRRPPALLFFGSYRYVPNREALAFINKTLAPELERAGVRAEIWIAGRDIPSLTYHPSIRLLGFVPDIHATLREADLCIVPVWSGTGILTKILDAMAVGTPMVLSSFAAEMVPGIQDRVHAFVARSKEEFPSSVAEALRETPARAAIATQSRELLEERYSWESVQAGLNALLEEMASRTGRAG